MSSSPDPVREDNAVLFAECSAWGYALAHLAGSTARNAPHETRAIRWLMSRRFEALLKQGRMVPLVDCIVDELSKGLGRWRASSLAHEIVERLGRTPEQQEQEAFDVF